MSCVGLLPIPAGTPHVSSPAADDIIPEDDLALVQYGQPSRMIGGPLMMEAALKVDRCLARLQNLQGTVTLPAPAVSATVSACISPVYSRSKSCIGSPRFEKEEKEPVIRIHDILSFSEDFNGKLSTLTPKRKGKYLRRLSLSKTEVFDDKKDPLDPHGEWKHWSSGAGDVHKVVSEILMASQIAKEITSMVNACLVNGELGSSDEEKAARKSNNNKHKNNNSNNNYNKLKAQASSSNNKGSVIAASSSSSRRILKKQDPMHKFRVMTSSDGSKRRHSSAGASSSSRREVLYPKSKPIPADLMRPSEANLAQEISSTERKMQSRRSPRGGAPASSSRISAEEPVRKSRSKTVAATPARATSSAEASSSSGSKNQRRVVVVGTGEKSRTAGGGSQRRTLLKVAGGPSLAGAGTPRASVEWSLAKAHAPVAREHDAVIEDGPAAARLLSEEAVSKRGTSVREADGRIPSGVTSAVLASADDLLWNKLRARVAAAASSVKDPSSVDQSSGGNNNIRVAGAVANVNNTDPVLAKIQTKVVATSMAQTRATTAAAGTEEDPVLKRILARVAAAAEPLTRSPVSEEEELPATIRSRAAGTPRKSAAAAAVTTSLGMWEAKEITNSHNSPRAAVGGMLSKKQAAGATAIGSTSSAGAAVIKGVRSSRSPPQTSAVAGVEPRLSPSSVGESAAVQSSATTFWRDTFNKIHVQQQLPLSATAVQTPASEALPPPEQSSKFSRSPSRSRGSSSPRIRILPHQQQQGVPTTGAANTIRKASPNAVINGKAITSQEENGSVTSKSSFKSGRNEDWFKKSLEATEISLGPGGKLWGRSGGNNKAVLFSNPTFAPASPPGARPSPGRSRSSTPTPSNGNHNAPAVRQPSPKRSTSATRRMREWVENILPRRRSVSPNIGGRSLPSLISRLPSRGRKASVSAPRASYFPFSSSRNEAPAPAEAGEERIHLPLPPCREAEQRIHLPLPPCRQAEQLAASKLKELPPARRQVIELKAHKERMDRQAHHMAAQKLIMVQDWNRTVEPPAPFEKDVGVAEQPPAPFLYSKRQLNDMGFNDVKKKPLEDTECTPKVGRDLDVKYSWGKKETELPAIEKETEIVEFTQGLRMEEEEVGARRVLSQCKSVNQGQGVVAAAAWNGPDKENIGLVAKGFGVGALRKSCSVNSQRSTSTIRAMSTGKIRPGPSFLKRAKEWMRTQTPFRDRPQKTTAL
ncbi:hypothetical protein R1flu_007453 [Riccia fluitans]|uniref:Uncharacterized protein n=1 Tax=Riccia fluitans TaxID=41844 RepID=A0ABD1YYX2_9MARC